MSQRALPVLHSPANNPLDSRMRFNLCARSRIRPTDHHPDFIRHGKISVLVLAELGCGESKQPLTRINK